MTTSEAPSDLHPAGQGDAPSPEDLAPLRRALAPVAVVAVSLASYASAARSGFVWDDYTAIVRGRLIGSLRNIPALFTHDTMFNSDGGEFAASSRLLTYRPLTMATFFVEHALWGARPLGYHLVNVAIHCVVAVLLYTTGRRLGASREGASLGAALFASHPSISEAVHWINGRSDPLCEALVLGALVLALSPKRPGPASLVASALLTLCATFSKETAFLLLPAAALTLCATPVRARLGSTLWLRLAPWAVGLLVGMVCRVMALRGVAALQGEGALAWAAWRYPALALDALASLALPDARFVASIHLMYRDVSTARVLTGALALAALGALASRSWRRGGAFAPWAVVTFATTLFPIAILSFRDGWSGWGRYLYASAAPACLGLGVLFVDALGQRVRAGLRRGLLASAALAVLWMTALTYGAGARWNNQGAYAIALIEDQPTCAAGYSELALVESWLGRYERSYALAQEAMRLDPSGGLHYSRAAGAAQRLGRDAEARQLARAAVARGTTDETAYYVLVDDLLDRAQPQAAARVLAMLIARNPADASVWALLDRSVRHPREGARLSDELLARSRHPSLRGVSSRLRAHLTAGRPGAGAR